MCRSSSSGSLVLTKLGMKMRGGRKWEAQWDHGLVHRNEKTCCSWLSRIYNSNSLLQSQREGSLVLFPPLPFQFSFSFMISIFYPVPFSDEAPRGFLIPYLAAFSARSLAVLAMPRSCVNHFQMRKCTNFLRPFNLAQETLVRNEKCQPTHE